MPEADIFLQLESQRAGAIKGESTDPAHPGEIQVTDWSWGMTGSPAMGGAGAALKTALSELHVYKRADTATTALMAVMRNNDIVKKAVLSVRKAGGTPIDYFVVTVQQARITSYEVRSRSEVDPFLHEHFTLAFQKIEVAYCAQDEKGAKKGASVFVGDVSA